MKPDSRPGDRPVSGAPGAAASSLPSLSGGCDAELRLIAEQAQMLTQSSGAAIALLQGDIMRCRARAGTTAPDLGAPLDTQSGLSGECVRGGVTLVCDDTESDPRVNLEVCRYLGIRSIAVLPISVEGSTVGVFEVFSSHPQAFSRNEVAALESMRDLVISVIRPAPQSESPAVSALNARASQESPAPSPLSTLFSDPEDDLICEIEQRAPGQPQPDPVRRAFELIKTGSQEAARPAMPFANPDPADDLICEIETRSFEPLGAAAEPEHMHPFSTFAPAPAHPSERPVSRKLIVVGIIVALAGLIWLRWCNRAQTAAKNISREHVAVAASTITAAPNAPPKAVRPLASETAAVASSPPDLPTQASANKSYGDLADPAPNQGPRPERRIRPAPSMVRKGPPPAYAGARDGPENPPLAMAKPQSSPLVAPPPASSTPPPAASASAATPRASTQPQAPAARAAVAPPTGTPPSLPVSVAPHPKQLNTRLSLSQAVVTTAADSGNGNSLTPQAFRLLRDSAKAGDGSAQLALAISYANGEGVRQSYSEALKWFTRAQAQGILPRGQRADQAWTKVQQWAQTHPQKN